MQAELCYDVSSSHTPCLVHQLMHEVLVAANDASRITQFLQVGQLVPGAADFAGNHPDRRNNQLSQNLRIQFGEVLERNKQDKKPGIMPGSVFNLKKPYALNPRFTSIGSILGSCPRHAR